MQTILFISHEICCYEIEKNVFEKYVLNFDVSMKWDFEILMK